MGINQKECIFASLILMGGYRIVPLGFSVRMDNLLDSVHNYSSYFGHNMGSSAKGKTKDKVLAAKINRYELNHSCAEIPSPIQVYAVETVEANNVEGPAEVVEDINGLLLIDELIDLGFKEKNSENFEQAASYFSRALSLDPMPDLAFYLIIDCYWLWNNLGVRDYALTQLYTYIPKYLPQFNTQLRYQFETWMTKEDLHKMFE